MKYFYRSKDYVYLGFDPDTKLQEVLKRDFFAQFNPANKEWYVRVDMTNISSINIFLEENDFTEEKIEREQKFNLQPISEKLDITDLKLILPELGLKRQLRDYQIEGVYYMLNHGNCINGSDVGTGKAQPIDTNILSPKGIIKMKDIKIGDEIFGLDGKCQKVIGVYPQGFLDSYEVIFTDGTKTQCCKEHIWTVANTVTPKKFREKTLEDLMKSPLRICPKNGHYGEGMHKTYGNWKWRIPILENPVEFTEKDVLIDPYTLGVLLGDGYFGNTILFSTSDREIFDYLKLPEDLIFEKQSQYDYSIVKEKNRNNKENKLKTYLKEYGLLGEKSLTKFIPKDYLYNTSQTRIEILRGLIDADGYVDKNGLIEFNSSSIQLITDVIFLARSLGCISQPIRQYPGSYVNKFEKKIECQIGYRVTLITNENLCLVKLTRKKELLRKKNRRYLKQIQEINYVGQKEMQCIKVSNSNGLYLCDDFIVTHNTSITLVMFELIDTFPCLIVCPSTVKESWKAEWERWSPNRTLSIINSGSKKNSWNADVIVINYDALGMKSGRGIKVKFPELLSIKFKAIVADEIHFLKNWKAVRSKAFMKIASKISIKIGLSGTVILNRPSELINILKVIGRFQEIFQDLDHYLYRYCNMKITRFGKETKDASNVKELYKLLNHYCYFRKEKREVLTELPPIVETFVNCKVNNKKIYREAETDFISFLELADETKVDAALKAKHLVQLNLLSLLSIDGKLKAIQEHLKDWVESNEEQKLLVFGVHVEPLEQLSKCFPESGLITGSISLDKKMKVLEQFKTSKKMQILFANIQCIGTGVDGLQNVCSNAAVIELPIRPGDLVQGLGRLERMGQKSSINVFYLMNEETIDGRIWKMLKEKKEVTDVVNKGYLDDLSLSLINSYKKK